MNVVNVDQIHWSHRFKSDHDKTDKIENMLQNKKQDKRNECWKKKSETNEFSWKRDYKYKNEIRPYFRRNRFMYFFTLCISH